MVCGSLSKTYSITGWRLGYAFGPVSAVDAMRKTHDFLTVGAAAPLQEVALASLALPDSYYDELRLQYPDGAYYVPVDIPEFDATADTGFCYWLAEHVGVAAGPGSSE